MKGKLILEDGSVFYGELVGDNGVVGEVVFNTGMTGYQEILTDPSYCGQIVTLTYPMVGNYGVADLFEQSRQSFVRGFIISELAEEPSNWQMENTLKDYLIKNHIQCIYGVDTRAITRRIRAQGTMKGVIVPVETSDEEVAEYFARPAVTHEVKEVTTPEVYRIENDGPHIVVIDFGIKNNILHSLSNLGCSLTVVPSSMGVKKILALKPDGIFLSNGPGDPKDVVDGIRQLKN